MLILFTLNKCKKRHAEDCVRIYSEHCRQLAKLFVATSATRQYENAYDNVTSGNFLSYCRLTLQCVILYTDPSTAGISCRKSMIV